MRNEYLAAENRILKAQLKTRLRLTGAERATLAEIVHRLVRKALEDVANTAKPDTIMGWYRRPVARKFEGSKSRRYPGRPRIDDEIEQWELRMAKENSDWGYDRIVGAMATSATGYPIKRLAVIDVFLQARRDGAAAKCFFKRLLKNHHGEPRKIVTDKLRSYGVAHRELMPERIHDTTQYANNRAELSHQPTQVRRGACDALVPPNKRNAF